MTDDAANRIDARFTQLARDGRKGLWPYITAGYPDLDTTARLLEALDGLGVAGVELGFPYSDPVADGPVRDSGKTIYIDNYVPPTDD